MKYNLKGHPFQVFRARSQMNLLPQEGGYAIVPDDLLDGGKFDETRYAASSWPKLNAKANPNYLGSALFPDHQQPAADKSEALLDFLDRLEELA